LITYLIVLFQQKLQSANVANYEMTRATRKSAVFYYDAKITHENV